MTPSTETRTQLLHPKVISIATLDGAISPGCSPPRSPEILSLGTGVQGHRAGTGRVGLQAQRPPGAGELRQGTDGCRNHRGKGAPPTEAEPGFLLAPGVTGLMGHLGSSCGHPGWGGTGTVGRATHTLKAAGITSLLFLGQHSQRGSTKPERGRLVRNSMGVSVRTFRPHDHPGTASLEMQEKREGSHLPVMARLLSSG